MIVYRCREMSDLYVFEPVIGFQVKGNVRNGGNLNVREMNVRKRTIPVRSENDTPIL